MVDRDAQAISLIHAKLVQSREELRSILDPAPGEYAYAGFPRSRTMQMLLSSRGLGTLGALAGGLLIARPALALRLLRLVPAGSVAKMIMARAIGALKSKSRDGA